MNFDTQFQKHNIPTPPTPIGPSKFTRWGGKHQNRYSAIQLGNDGLYVKDFLTDEEHHWFDNDNRPLSAEEKRKRAADIAISKRALETSIKEHARQAADLASYLWQQGSLAGESAYLNRKKVKAHGIRFHDNKLYVPLRNIEGELCSLQYIEPNGNKRFLAGGHKTGMFHCLGSLQDASHIYICEGYATAASIFEATNMPTICALDASNLEPVTSTIRKKYPDLRITIAADNDQWPNKDGIIRNVGVKKASKVSQLHHCRLKIPDFSKCEQDIIELHKPTDFNDVARLLGADELIRQLDIGTEPDPETNSQPITAPCERSQPVLKPINIDDFLGLDIKQREMLLHPIIPKQGVAMLYAYRGIGKTHTALGIAYALATGGTFLNWNAAKPRKVLYIDGEMPAPTMQERLKHEIARNSKTPPSPDYLQIITPDLQDKGIPSLSDPEGQNAVNAHLQDVDVVIIDNISTLCRGGRENESESWSPVQEWVLNLRKRGISILFVHHAGKNQQQRGSSKKEDIMDTVISLRRPNNYKTSEGARFEVHYEKARGFSGNEARPFEAWLKSDEHSSQWQISDIETAEDVENTECSKVLELHSKGLNQRQIAKEVGFSAAKVNRLLNRYRQGLLLQDQEV